MIEGKREEDTDLKFHKGFDIIYPVNGLHGILGISIILDTFFQHQMLYGN